MKLKLSALIISIFSITGMVAVTSPVVSAEPFDFFSSKCEKVKDSELCGPCKGNQDATICQDAKSTGNPIYGPEGVIALAVNILSVIIGVAAVIVIIIAGIQYMLSTGDPTKVNNSKNAILYAIVGLIVAAVSQVIVKFIISKIG